MSDRKTMDRPAIAIGAVLGIALIAVSLPFTIQFWSELGDEFELAWSEGAGPAGVAVLADGVANETVTVEVDFQRTSAAVIRAVECIDSRVQTVQGDAVVTWMVTRDGEEVGTGSFTCFDEETEWRIELSEMPGLDHAHGEDAHEAELDAWTQIFGGNETASYQLSVSWSRDAGSAPALPVGQPTFQAEVELEVQKWDVEAVEAPEVVR